MSIRAKEILVIVMILVFSLVFYFRKMAGGKEIIFSHPVAWVLIALLVLSLGLILILTIKGSLIGRRVVFIYVGIVLALPLFMPFTQKITISPEVRSLYEAVEKLPPGSKVLVSFDYDPPSAPELQPMGESFIRLCFQRDLKVIIMGLWPQGPQQANIAIDKILEDPEMKARNLRYGEDYVNLGYQAGNEFVIQRMGSSFKSMFPSDYRGIPYDSMPLVRNIRNFSNIDFSFNLSAGFPGSVEWVQIAVDRYGVELGLGNTAVQAPQMYTYLNSGQLVGILGGMNGGAEFELLCDYKGKATKFMLSQSFSHMVIIAFIIIGNVAYFLGGRKSALKDK